MDSRLDTHIKTIVNKWRNAHSSGSKMAKIIVPMRPNNFF
jgi:hypothetical protein